MMEVMLSLMMMIVMIKYHDNDGHQHHVCFIMNINTVHNMPWTNIYMMLMRWNLEFGKECVHTKLRKGKVCHCHIISISIQGYTIRVEVAFVAVVVLFANS